MSTLNHERQCRVFFFFLEGGMDAIISKYIFKTDFIKWIGKCSLLFWYLEEIV